MSEEELIKFAKNRIERNRQLKKEFDNMCRSDLETAYYYIKHVLKNKYNASL